MEVSAQSPRPPIGPLVVSVKNLTVLTTGAPADIGVIILPPWLTRWNSVIAGSQGNGSLLVAESAAGTLAAGTWSLWTGPGGTGSPVSSGTNTMPTAAGGIVAGTAANNATLNTSNVIYVHQVANSANAGTVSVYVHIYPLI